MKLYEHDECIIGLSTIVGTRMCYKTQRYLVRRVYEEIKIDYSRRGYNYIRLLTLLRDVNH